MLELILKIREKRIVLVPLVGYQDLLVAKRRNIFYGKGCYHQNKRHQKS